MDFIDQKLLKGSLEVQADGLQWRNFSFFNCLDQRGIFYRGKMGSKRTFLLVIEIVLFVAIPVTWLAVGGMYFGLAVDPPFMPLGACPGKKEVYLSFMHLVWIAPVLLSPFILFQIKKLLGNRRLLFVVSVVLSSLVLGFIFGILGAFLVTHFSLPADLRNVCECASDIDPKIRSYACELWKERI